MADNALEPPILASSLARGRRVGRVVPAARFGALRAATQRER